MFFGRNEILGQLEELSYKRVSSLVTCRGRRRVGKSTLIEEFARRTHAAFLKLEGRKPEKDIGNADELANFAAQLSQQTGCDPTPPQNWLNAFARLNDKISDDRRTVVLLDEISWMAHYDEAFASTLKIAWDNLLKKHDGLILVLCGSVSSWIRDNVVDNGAYLGRRSLDIVLQELPPEECVKFWGDAAARTSTREIVDVLSVTGGVPRYLEEIIPSLSAEENIRRLCFRRNAVLRVDFDQMFEDVISREQGFAGKVLRCLTDGPQSAAEITERLGLGKGGRVTGALELLEEAGFAAEIAARNPETGEVPRERRYRLKDNYCRFYLKYIEPVKDAIDSGAYEFSRLDDLAGIDAVMGLQFENLVVNHCRSLIGHLHLGSSIVKSAAAYYRRGTKARKGVQVDLLIQTEKANCIVEVKRQKKIEHDVIEEVDEKVRLIRRRPGVSMKTALVYDGELARSVETDGYFDALVSSSRLLGIDKLPNY